MALLVSRSSKLFSPPCISSRICLLSSFSSTSTDLLPRLNRVLCQAPNHHPPAAPLTLDSLLDDVEPPSTSRGTRLPRKQRPSASPALARGAQRIDTRSFPFADEKSFAALELSRPVLRRLQEEGLQVPTDVQVAAIPVVLDGHDAAIQSYTGSGKTLAYLLPILSRVGPLMRPLDDVTGDGGASPGGAEEQQQQQQTIPKGGVQVLIVVPSRELAMQIVREVERILSPENRRLIQQLIGGANPHRQEEGLKKNKPIIVVGTPGRISELSRAGKLHTHACQFLVLDEADQLLSSKFRDDMRRILEHVGQRRSSPLANSFAAAVAEKKEKKQQLQQQQQRKVERQTILVSATMPAAVLRAAAVWGHKPLLVRATSVIDVEETPGQALEQEDGFAANLNSARESLPPNLEHFYLTCPVHHRVDNLRKCIHALEAQSVIVFMNHSRRLKDTEFKLQARDIAAGSLSGDLTKLERASVLSAFRSGKLRVLLVSEVGARGLDVPACDLVVNLELPTDGSHYAHRAGRTGRLGRKGRVVTICEGSEEFVVEKFERQLGVKIPEANLFEGKFKLRGKKSNSSQKESSSKGKTTQLESVPL